MFLYLFFRRVLAGTLSAGAMAAALALPASAQEVITLQLDRAKVLELPAGTNTLVLGNPAIADATVLRRQNRIVLTARSFGETNMIALDARGGALAEILLRVTSPDHALIVQRGLERETWSCNPRCEPAVNPGDAARHTTEAITQATQRNSAAQPNAAAR